MIFGIGTDIIEVERVNTLISKGRDYLETIFTQKEIEYCESRAHKAEHYAARFAAKEATLKAFGTGWRDGLAFIDIEIVNDELGKPKVNLHGDAKLFSERNQLKDVSISLSHIKDIAIAVVILEN